LEVKNQLYQGRLQYLGVQEHAEAMRKTAENNAAKNRFEGPGKKHR
jgi:hypothetical protein